MMNNNEKQDQPIDPILIEKLKLLGATPDRNPDLVARRRERFLAELGGLPAASSPVSKGWFAGLFRSGPGRSSVQIFNRSFALSTILAMILVAIMLFGGASATAFASQSSLPGDALYPIKMGLEQTQISLANDAYAQAKLHLQFAQRRLDEIKELLMQGRTNDVEYASNEFEFFIQQAMQATDTVMTADPERGAELSNLVSKALLDYAIALKAVLLEAPDPVKPVVEKALLVSRDGAGEEIEIFGVVESLSEMEIRIDGEMYLVNELTEFDDVIAVGDSVKIHAILTPEGTMIIREIELAAVSEDDIPGFGNDNGNSNDSLPIENGNINANDDGNENYSQENESESEDNENRNESNDNVNENDSEENVNENESDEKEDIKSEDIQNENISEGNDKHSDENKNTSEDNDNHTDENENKSEDNDNGNTNGSQEEEEKEGNSNGG